MILFLSLLFPPLLQLVIIPCPILTLLSPLPSTSNSFAQPPLQSCTVPRVQRSTAPRTSLRLYQPSRRDQVSDSGGAEGVSQHATTLRLSKPQKQLRSQCLSRRHSSMLIPLLLLLLLLQRGRLRKRCDQQSDGRLEAHTTGRLVRDRRCLSMPPVSCPPTRGPGPSWTTLPASRRQTAPTCPTTPGIPHTGPGRRHRE
jgi:hypothetical protein